MADGNRVYPVDYLVMHHSTGPVFPEASDREVQNWFSAVGKSRGYQNGAINPFHTIPGTNELSYAMAQYALHPYTKDGNKYGWRLTELISDPWNNVAWHAGNWPVNQRSIGIETCGNYVGQELPDKALMLVADFWRPQDQALGGKSLTWYHAQITATACPGMIANQINKLVDMQNDPTKWNKLLWPPVVVPPPVDTRSEWQKNMVDKADFQAYAQANGAKLVNLETGAVIKEFPTNTVFDISAETNVKGKAYFITAYSHSKGQPNGILASELGPEVKPVPPTPEVPVPPVVPPVTEPDYGKENNALLKQILEIVTAIWQKIAGVFK